MKNSLLVSIILAMIVIPIVAARDPNPVRAIKKALLYSLAFAFVYLLAIRFVYPRLP